MVYLEQIQSLTQEINKCSSIDKQNLVFTAFLELVSKCSEKTQILKNSDFLDTKFQFELNSIYRQIVPRWHFAMLNDVERNNAFETAIEKVVTQDCTVLDVGSGSGLLAMIAARVGAKSVVSCESVGSIAYLAQKIVALNGLEEQINIVPKYSYELVVGKDLHERADILVTETVDCGLVGEGILPIIRHARQSLLKEDAVIIPARATIKFALLESSTVHKSNFVSNASRFDVSTFNMFSTLGYFPVRLNTWPYRLLSQPSTAFEFDFRQDSLEPSRRRKIVEVKQSGICHGIVFWFELDLGNGVVYSNSIENKKSHWMQAVQCFEKPITILQDELLEFEISQSDTNIEFRYTKCFNKPPLNTSGSSRSLQGVSFAEI